MPDWIRTTGAALFVASWAVLGACGDDDDDRGATAADKIGVGAMCKVNADCLDGQICLLNFKGGYCGLKDCTGLADCPNGSDCVEHTDGLKYCFRICVDKAECNRNRDLDFESNCSSNITFVEGKPSYKACVPPSG
jgi:hypothetical protein